MTDPTPATDPSAARKKRPRRLWSLASVRLPQGVRPDGPTASEAAGELSWLLVVVVLGFLFVARRDIAPAAVTSILAAVLVYALIMLLLQVFKPARASSPWPMLVRAWAMIALITWVVWVADDTRSPLTNLYYLVIIASALTLGARATVVNCVLIATCVLLLDARDDAPFSTRMVTVFLQLAPLLVVAYFATRVGADIRRALDRIRFISEIDELTRLYNLRAFMTIAERLHRQARRYKRPYALVMIDSDNLKTINDTYGHGAGNDLLRLTTLGIRRLLRETDVAARYGGDEFILLLPETNAAGARELGERIRRAVEKKPLDVRGRHVATSVSLGVAGFPEHGDDLHSILNKADQAMYLSKKTGRNRVTVFDPG